MSGGLGTGEYKNYVLRINSLFSLKTLRLKKLAIGLDGFDCRCFAIGEREGLG